MGLAMFKGGLGFHMVSPNGPRQMRLIASWWPNTNSQPCRRAAKRWGILCSAGDVARHWCTIWHCHVLFGYAQMLWSSMVYYHLIILPSYHIILSSYHLIIVSCYHIIILSSYHLIISSYHHNHHHHHHHHYHQQQHHQHHHHHHHHHNDNNTNQYIIYIITYIYIRWW